MAYTFEQSYYFRPYRGNSSFWLNRYGNGSIASHQKATLYTAAGSADQRLKVHKVSGGCQLLSDLNNAYGLNIYGTKAGIVCDFYPVSGNFNDALIDLLTVDAANNLYRIKMINHNLYLTPASNSSGAALTWENAKMEILETKRGKSGVQSIVVLCGEYTAELTFCENCEKDVMIPIKELIMSAYDLRKQREEQDNR